HTEIWASGRGVPWAPARGLGWRSRGPALMRRSWCFGLGLLLSLAGPARCSEPAAGSTGTLAPAHARVVLVQDPAALEVFTPRREPVQAMVLRGLTNLTGKAT